MSMNSDRVFKGLQQAPHRSLFNALGFMLRYEFPSSRDEEIGKQLAKECLGRHENVSVDRIPNERILPADDSTKEE